MRFRLLVGAICVGVGVSILAWYSWQNNFAHTLQQGADQIQNLALHPEDILPLANQVIAPDPLRGPQTGELASLTSEGIFTATNAQRAAHSLPALARVAALDTAATNKLNDLFARQYFDHISPTGEGPSDGVTAVGYSYIKVGENLALGNFASDEALVQAWMDSPGHRANILASGFQEIGLAVGTGTFEGKKTWIGVQTFATPESACPQPNTITKQKIETNQVAIANLEDDLADIKAEIDALLEKEYDSNEEKKAAQEELDDLRDQYNQLVAQVNTLITQTKELISQYNTSVQTFNACLQSLE